MGNWPTGNDGASSGVYPHPSNLALTGLGYGKARVGSEDVADADWTGPPTYRYNLKSYLEDALDSGSPFAEAVAYDPGGDIEELLARFDQYNATVEDIPDAADAWRDFIDVALEKADEVLAGGTIEEQVAEFTEAYDEDYDDRVNEFMAARWDAGSVNSSAFAIGLAVYSGRRDRAIRNFETQARLDKNKQRSLFVMQAVEKLSGLLLSKTEAERVATGVYADMVKITIDAQSNYYGRELEIAVREATWDLDLFKYGIPIIGAAAGLPQAVTPPYPLLSAITPPATLALQAGQSAASLGMSGISGILNIAAMAMK
jgi:tetratricopeptide (TPR) repeat protein